MMRYHDAIAIPKQFENPNGIQVRTAEMRATTWRSHGIHRCGRQYAVAQGNDGYRSSACRQKRIDNIRVQEGAETKYPPNRMSAGTGQSARS